MSQRPDDPGDLADDGSGPSARSILQLGVIVAVCGGFAAFILQNTEEAELEWLSFSGSVPLWLALVASALVGVVLTLLFQVVLRRSRRRA